MNQKILSFSFSAFLVILSFIIPYVYSFCFGFQSKNDCLGSENSCCWTQYKFQGELIRNCIMNDGEDPFIGLRDIPELSEFSSECAGQPEKDNCQVKSENPTQEECFNAKGDCCYITIKFNFNHEEQSINPENIQQTSTANDCLLNTYGSEKAYENAFQQTYTEEYSQGTESGQTNTNNEIKAKCKTNSGSFFSICYEQADESSCLKADSNCCWIKTKLKATDPNNSYSKKYEMKTCAFNPFSSATIAKNYEKTILAYEMSNSEENNGGGERLPSEFLYDYMCSKHDYAVYGGSGKVTKDGDNPTITYDFDSTGEKGEKKLKDAVDDSIMIKVSYKIIMAFIWILLF